MKLLILGGSGQLSGRVAAQGLEQGHEVWTLTRGRRPLPEGVHSLVADRGDHDAVRAAVEAANVRWDACLDCTAQTPVDAKLCVEVFVLKETISPHKSNRAYHTVLYILPVVNNNL
jgi:nucleoside-diphosphate-sugar epimerase